MRDHSKHIQVTREEAIEAILGACDFHPGTETVPVYDAIGRVLAADAVAQLDMPNSLTCCMDSVAVHWSDFENGMPDTSAWKRCVDWQFANTGVGMPEGFDTAIVVEHAQISADDEHVAFDAAPSKQFAGTIPAGSRMHAGEVLVSAGTLITPLLAAHIASGGNALVDVVVKPRVAFLPTGNELVPVGAPVPAGKNIDSNSVLMKGKIEEWGGEPVLFPITPDDPEQIEAALRRAVAIADIVVLNAGSSKGSDDYSLEILERIGRVLYHQTNHGPGHHSSCSVLENTPVIGISGPPGGAAFTTDFYLRPAMQKFLGQSTDPVRINVRLAAPLPQGGPGGPQGKKGAHPHAPAGEQRPREGGSFFGVKQVALKLGADGVLEAFPTKSGRPGPVEAEGADAYYLAENGPGIKPAEVGDTIEVTLRP
jgi:molybdopterin molybdotransferase